MAEIKPEPTKFSSSRQPGSGPPQGVQRSLARAPVNYHASRSLPHDSVTASATVHQASSSRMPSQHVSSFSQGPAVSVGQSQSAPSLLGLQPHE